MGKIEKVKNLLTPKEFDAYTRYVQSGRPSLSPSTAAQFFSVFLQGYSCEQIELQNPSYGLGLIVQACVEHNWHQRKEEYTLQLMDTVRETVQKSTLEAIKFASDGMAVFHKIAGDRFRKYLATGNIDVLGDWSDMSFKTYKDLTTQLMQLTGQGDAKRVKNEVKDLLNDRDDGSAIDTEYSVTEKTRPLTAESAANLLSVFNSEQEQTLGDD